MRQALIRARGGLGWASTGRDRGRTADRGIACFHVRPEETTPIHAGAAGIVGPNSFVPAGAAGHDDGVGTLDDDDFPSWVARLADPVRAQAAFWHLVGSGPPALPAVRAGLASPAADVRFHCTRIMDHLADPHGFGALVGMLADPVPRVRAQALHALACERCKDNECRPDPARVLGPAIGLLRSDPFGAVRVHAAEVVGRWVHTHPEAARALQDAAEADPSPTVRKKAGWFAPGGPIFTRTAPR